MSTTELNPPGDQENGKEGISFGSYRFPDSVKAGKTDTAKDGFTLGGVKKPKFKPVAKKAAAAYKVDTGNIQELTLPLIHTSTPSNSQSNFVFPTSESRFTANTQDRAAIEIKQEDRRMQPKKNNQNPRQNKPIQRQQQPRFLVSGESRFFATNTNRRQAGNAMDNAFLMSQQMGSNRNAVKDEEDDFVQEMVIEETTDDREMPIAQNGPIRFPYIADNSQLQQSSTVSWDEDDTQVTALELLQGVNDGDLLLFSLPSFLPVYSNNSPYGIDEEIYVRNNSIKPHDYVKNELQSVVSGRIGKMRVHESGRISMDINGYIVDMSVSIPLRYQQQVATVDENGIYILGDVTHRLVLIPDIQNFSFVC